MGIADLFRPKYRHSDIRVRTEAVKALTAEDAAILEKIARTDRDAGVRRLALEKIAEAPLLAELAAAESERSLRDFAGERAAQLWLSKACSADEELASDALSGLIKLTGARALVDVAVKAQLPAIRKRAFSELRDPRALAELAKGSGPQDLRLAAIARIDDADVLRAVAIDTTTKEIGLAAVEKLDDAERLGQIAQKAKNKAVRQRARKIVQEIPDAEKTKRAAAPAVPDDVKRRRAEKAQLVRELEGCADTFEFDKVSARVKAAEEAWATLVAAGSDDGDERFTRAVERFWKRKDVFEQQARSTDELRAIEREARKAKERAAAERAAEPAAEARPAPEAEDPERAAHEAEAQARRAAREQRKAEEDARRAADQAAREARKQEQVERSASVAAALTAMIADMEKLATEGTRDARALDRLLQQAARTFDQIGKVMGDERDALADRYSAVRGKLVVRASELREAEDWQRFQNVPKAEALVATAKEMAAEAPSPDLGNRLRQLQALWKEVGPMPQRRSKELWEQFKRTCDEIYDKVKGFREVESERFAEVAKVKEALIAEAEALSDAEVTPQAASALKALQARWKESGHLPRKQGDELWRRFRAACDKFFARRKPLIDAEQAEQTRNLAAKQALIDRVRTLVSAAPGDAGWGKAIAQLKELQGEWQRIGYVPRKDADAVYAAFRAACDSLFAKRDEARDAEATTRRAAIEQVKADIAGVLGGGDDRIARAIALCGQARELESAELAASIDQMVRQVVASEPDAVKGTELDPARLRARREKLIARAEELLPRQAPATQPSPDSGLAAVAAQLQQSMRANAFGDLRFSGRDPVEVVDELRAQWREAGPLLDDADAAQATRFEDLVRRVLDSAGAAARAERTADRDDDRDGRGRRGRPEREADDGGRRRSRRAAEAPLSASGPIVDSPSAAIPRPAHDASTAPAQRPFEALPAPAVPATSADAAPAAEPPTRAKPVTIVPTMEEIDVGWDMGDDDPTATSEDAQAAAAADAEMTRPAPAAPPSATEMAGDGAAGGDGIDEPGRD